MQFPGGQMRVVVMVSLLGLSSGLGCGREKLVPVEAVRVAPASLTFDATEGDPEAKRPVIFENDSNTSITLSLTVTDGFEVDPTSLSLAPGEQGTAQVGFTGAPGTIEGNLVAASTWTVDQVPLSGVMHHRCAPSPAPCEAFRELDGVCQLVIESDGTACTDGCISGACSQGVCVGTAAGCDDHDACTADGCGAAGCVHQPIECTSDDPCQVPSCDPSTGCTTTAVADGTSCGAADCATAAICLAGRCTIATTPEGTPCGDPSPCQETGVCRNSECVRADPHELVPEWTLAPSSPDGTFTFPGVVDGLGNLYWFETESSGGQITVPPSPNPWWLVSVSPNGTMRFRVSIEVPRPLDTINDWWPEAGWLSLVGDQLLSSPVASRAQLEARDSTTGDLLWSHDFSTDLTQGQACPGGWTSQVVAAPVALSTSEVAVAASAQCTGGVANLLAVFDLDANGMVLRQHPVNGWTSVETLLIGDGLGNSYLCDEQHIDRFTPSSDSTGDVPLGAMRGGFSLNLSVFGGRLLGTAFELIDLSGVSAPIPLGPDTGLPTGISPVMGADLIGLFPMGREYWAYRADGQFKWRHTFDTNTVSSPILTDTGGSLFVTSGTTEDHLVLIGSDGQQVFSCGLGTHLQAAEWTQPTSVAALQNGRLVWSGTQNSIGVRSVALPGIRPATHGWITAGGNLQRTGSPLP